MADGLNQRLARISLKLLAEPANKDVDQFGVIFMLSLPDVFA